MIEFRRRNKYKEINPPMRYTNKIAYSISMPRKSKSVLENPKNNHFEIKYFIFQDNELFEKISDDVLIRFIINRAYKW